ncbi:MAG: peptide-methionine (S)-S-oxide reductase MsrA [Rhodanobacteraceae bacterium]
MRAGRIIASTLVLLLAFGAIQSLHAAPTPAPKAGLERATFAGGCFWCMEPPFINLPGVEKVTAGYTGGDKIDPTYEEVSSGTTGHAESVEVVFDPRIVDYAQLLHIYWHNVDPTEQDRQFCDSGNQYRTAIFYHSPEQKQKAEASKAAIEKLSQFAGKTLYTQIVPAGPFYAAEEYHQEYFRKNPVRYKFYRWNCGRDQRLEQIWGEAPKH